MLACNDEMWLPSFRSSKPEIDSATWSLTSSSIPTSQGRACCSSMIIQGYKGWDYKRSYGQQSDIVRSTLTINLTLKIPLDPDSKSRESGECSTAPQTEILRAATFDNNLASSEMINASALQMRKFCLLPSVTSVVTAFENVGETETINPSVK